MADCAEDHLARAAGDLRWQRRRHLRRHGDQRAARSLRRRSAGGARDGQAELDPNGLANIPEFGTVKEASGFKALLAMSSYHQVKAGARYPAVLLVHGVNDTRVSVWQSTKYAHRLASATTGGPVLMRLDYQLGHGGGANRAQQQEQTVDIWSFMLSQMGVPEFQTK